MSKFKLTQTAAEVQGILNNSLQKPTGLTKTKLVGVGVNGQENIEIGDNLTLANGKLSSAATVGGVHCYVIQPQDYTAGHQYKFVYFTSKDIQGKQMSEADFFATALPPLHDHETNNYYPEIKQKVYLEQYPAQGRYQSQQVLFITITEYELFVYTWDAANNKVVANKALTWFAGGSDQNYWYIDKQY